MCSTIHKLKLKKIIFLYSLKFKAQWKLTIIYPFVVVKHIFLVKN